jgi:ABC-type antimicrobial peptide transport system permease subunit
VVYLQSGRISRLVVIAIVMGIPLSWYAVNSWLDGFAYHIQVSWLIFAAAALSALSVAWLTAGYESVKAASANPVKSLRTN